MIDDGNIKTILYNKCLQHVIDRTSNAQKAMKEAQEAANEESKSSAGDKYNSGRALMQIERDKYAKQFNEAQKLQQSMDLIQLGEKYEHVELGSLVETSIGNYYMSISMGKINVDSYTAFAISPVSPIGQQLLGKKEGDTVSFQNRKIAIKKIS